MTPHDVVTTLNEYFSAMMDIIFKYNGTLDKIVGDELMVVYGAPLEKEDDSDRAILTAIEMMQTLMELNKNRRKLLFLMQKYLLNLVLQNPVL